MSETPQRIGDAERDRAVEALREHHAAGRLTLDEFDERMQQALSARTSADLIPLFTDLPRDPGQEVDFLPVAKPLSVWPSSGLATSSWTEADEARLAKVRSYSSTMILVHVIAWPAVVLINSFVGFQAWWLFIVVGVVAGGLSGHFDEEKTKLLKRRTRAGLPPLPDDDEDELEDDDSSDPFDGPDSNRRRELR